MPISDQEFSDLEFERMQAQRAAAAQAQQEAAASQQAPARRKFNPTLPMVVDGVVTGEMPLSEHNKMTATALRGAPIAGAMAVGAAPSALALLGLGVTGYGTELLAQVAEGKKVDQGEAAAAGILSGAPVPIAKATRSFLPSVGQGIKGMLGLGTAATTANIAKRAIDTQQFPTYESVKADIKGAVVPAGLGFAGLGAGSRFAGVAEKKAEYEARRQLLAKIGVDKPTFGLLDPERIGWEQSVATRDPELATKIGQAQSGVTQEFLARLGTDPGNAAVAAELQKMIPVVDTAEKAYQNALAQTQKARTQLAELTQNPTLTPDKMQAVSDEVYANLVNGINQQAATMFARNAAIGNAVSPTVKAKEFANLVDQLYDARREISKVKYNATGIPQDQPLFLKTDLVEAAKAAMGADVAETNIGRGIVSAIEDMGAADRLTPNQVKILRGQMADKFASSDQTMNMAEASISKAYDAVKGAARNEIGVVYGSDVLNKWDQAQEFWRTTSQLRDSKFGRALLKNGEIADEAFQGLANKLVRGEVDELDNFKQFVESVGSNDGGKEIAKNAMQGMTDALRNAFIAKHTKSGSLKFDSLLGDLSNVSTFKDLPVPVEALGFGSVDTIRQWQRSLKSFKPGEVNQQVVDDLLASDNVRRVLSAGGKDAGKILEKATAERVLKDKINAEVAARYTDLTGTAREQSKQAQELIKKYQIDEDAWRGAYDLARNDPVLGAFSGQGSYTLTQELGKTGSGTVTDLLNRMPPPVAGKLMSALRQNNAQLADLVERRLLANELAGFVNTERTAPGVTSTLDVAKVREFFHPIHDTYSNSRLAFLQNVIGRDKVDNLRRFATDLSKVDDDLRRGAFKGGSTMGAGTVFGGLAVSQATPGVGKTQGMMLLNRINNAMSKKAYNVVAGALTNKDFANLVFGGSKSISEAIASMPTQKAYLILSDKPLASELGKLDSQ